MAVWRYHNTAYIFYKVVQKKGHCRHLYFWSCVKINGVAKKLHGSERKARYSQNICMLFLWASLIYVSSVFSLFFTKV